MTAQQNQQKLKNSSMDIYFDAEKSIAIFEPKEKLSKDDFDAAAKALDPFISEKGALQGLIIKTRDFPGWDSVEGLTEHFDFVKDHHDKINRVALVTDAPVAPLAEKLGKFLVKADVKHFDFSDAANAERWVAAA